MAKRKTAGRPEAVIDWNKVTKYLQAQCDSVGIAGLLGISVDTLYNRCKTDNNMEYSAFTAQKKGEGRELLRGKQYQVAMEGDKTMLVWLGKQYLEQKDKSDVTSGDKPLQEMKITVDNSETAETLKRLRDELANRS
jgi:hypothetical protein